MNLILSKMYVLYKSIRYNINLVICNSVICVGTQKENSDYNGIKCLF